MERGKSGDLAGEERRRAVVVGYSNSLGCVRNGTDLFGENIEMIYLYLLLYSILIIIY